MDKLSELKNQATYELMERLNEMSWRQHMDSIDLCHTLAGDAIADLSVADFIDILDESNMAWRVYGHMYDGDTFGSTALHLIREDIETVLLGARNEWQKHGRKKEKESS